MPDQNRDNGRPCVFLDPAVRAQCNGVPIYAYGYTYVLGESPDLIEDSHLQVDNDARRRKVPVKKSWEIRANRMGWNGSPMPRSVANDYRPLEPINLIDGNPTTCWSSISQTQPDLAPAWIRLDLPVECTVAKVVLRKRVPGAPRYLVGSASPDRDAVEVGMAMPAALIISMSRDAWHWETVFEGKTDDAPDRRDFAYEFPPRPAKQILVVGQGLPRVENWLHSFSIASVEVYDTTGRDMALATRGTGVTVSSTQRGLAEEIESHRVHWPLTCDCGVKWVRVGYHDDAINWHWVEKEPGKMAVDPEADAAITYLVERGVKIVMALGFGNRHYTQPDPTRKLPQMAEWYYENPAPPTTPEALEAWRRFVRFLVSHFRDRVDCFEIWNEWNIQPYWGAAPNVEHYLAIARATIPILRKIAPSAKIMLGSVSGFSYGIGGWSPEDLAAKQREDLFLRAVSELARDVDVIGWHPFYHTDPQTPRFQTYVDDVRALKSFCADKGFHGEYCASEWAYGANYPSASSPNWWGDFACSEIEKAKYIAQLTMAHIGLGVGSIYCGSYGVKYPLDLDLVRRSTAADPISPRQMQAGYYVMRNLATATEELEPSSFHFQLRGGPENVLAFALERPGERVVALWQSGPATDRSEGVPGDLIVDGRYASAIGYDPINGTAQDLRFRLEGESMIVPGVLVKDYPILIRLSSRQGRDV